MCPSWTSLSFVIFINHFNDTDTEAIVLDCSVKGSERVIESQENPTCSNEVSDNGRHDDL